MSKKNKVIPSSFSRAEDFGKCPLFFKYRHIDKIPDPRPELPEGQEYPNDRGIRIHTMAENVIKNPNLRIPDELALFDKRFETLRIMYKAKKCAPEVRLATRSDWTKSGFKEFDVTAWRGVIDALVMLSKHRAVVIDFKTGKKSGNEGKHYQQVAEYALTLALRNDNIQHFSLELWYLDSGEVSHYDATRSEILGTFQAVKNRHAKVNEAEYFYPTPTEYACRFCPYKTGLVGRGKKAYAGTGHCKKNVI